MGGGRIPVQTVNGFHPGSSALPAQVPFPSSSLSLPEGPNVSHMFQMLDCHTVSQKGCLGESTQSKLCLHTRGPGVFLLCRIIHFLTHRHQKLFFLSRVRLPHGQCELAGGVAALLFLTQERQAPSTTDLIDACARVLQPETSFFWGNLGS